jgi:hypothetical protein
MIKNQQDLWKPNEIQTKFEGKKNYLNQTRYIPRVSMTVGTKFFFFLCQNLNLIISAENWCPA